MGRTKKKGQVLVGFALETENGLANARKKLKDKRLDLVVLNDATEEGAAFESDTNKVTLVFPRKKPQKWPMASKSELSFKLLEVVAGLF
jgi:phosphopantothenoylcysteine decarboxylase/phosphopantothenate--cysteine ligase